VKTKWVRIRELAWNAVYCSMEEIDFRIRYTELEINGGLQLRAMPRSMKAGLALPPSHIPKKAISDHTVRQGGDRNKPNDMGLRGGPPVQQLKKVFGTQYKTFSKLISDKKIGVF